MEKYAKCMTNKFEYITKGKVYNILPSNALWSYKIADDNGDLNFYSEHNFKLVEEEVSVLEKLKEIDKKFDKMQEDIYVGKCWIQDIPIEVETKYINVSGVAIPNGTVVNIVSLDYKELYIDAEEENKKLKEIIKLLSELI